MLARLLQHVPELTLHQACYYGYYSNVARARRVEDEPRARSHSSPEVPSPVPPNAGACGARSPAEPPHLRGRKVLDHLATSHGTAELLVCGWCGNGIRDSYGIVRARDSVWRDYRHGRAARHGRESPRSAWLRPLLGSPLSATPRYISRLAGRSKSPPGAVGGSQPTVVRWIGENNPLSLTVVRRPEDLGGHRGATRSILRPQTTRRVAGFYPRLLAAPARSLFLRGGV